MGFGALGVAVLAAEASWAFKQRFRVESRGSVWEGLGRVWMCIHSRLRVGMLSALARTKRIGSFGL